MSPRPHAARLIIPALLVVLTVCAALLIVLLPNAPHAAYSQSAGTLHPTSTYPFHGTYTPPAQTPVFDIPPHIPLWPVDNDAIVNVLVLGSDSPDAMIRRTDVIILVSINTDAGTVAMWHIPRALFVYIPNHTLDLINTVYVRGEANNPGGGFPLLRETFRYNFGIELDYYARVNYEGFTTLVEQMGGLTISVDCAIRDWRLKAPDLDPANADNWEEYTLEMGRHRLPPDLALWYARSRKTTSDLDRGRRQMDLLRALWQQFKRDGLLSQIDVLWPWVEAYVDTNMAFEDTFALVPFALDLDPAGIARYGGTLGLHYATGYTPDNGREVLLPQREYLLPMIEDFLTPPTPNRLGRATVTIDVIDATWWDMGLHRVAADRLAWEGFAAQPIAAWGEIQRATTRITDYTGTTKGSPLPEIARILRVDEAQIVREPDPNRTVDVRVELGQAYNACVYGNAEAALGDTPAAEYLPEHIQAAGCWLRFRAEVNMRAGPGTNHDILDTATPNNLFAITGRDVAGTWWRVQTDDGLTGWVSAEINTAIAAGARCDSVLVVDPTNAVP
ncbi:MAG: LCP family protein [Anaerolineae bacterium]|nr:LCP family protein [Anaerolineae bacterium]